MSSREHQAPSTTSGSLVKVRLPKNIWEGDVAEIIWASQLNEDRAKLANIPFYAYKLSLNDIIDVNRIEDELQAVGVSIRSGHSTYRFFMKSEETARSVDSYWEPMRSLGCTYERASLRLFAVDVPASSDIHAVYRILEQGERNGLWEFEEGHCGHALAGDP